MKRVIRISAVTADFNKNLFLTLLGPLKIPLQSSSANRTTNFPYADDQHDIIHTPNDRNADNLILVK